jgi:hypothetical protein
LRRRDAKALKTARPLVTDPEALPELLDRKRLASETGLPRSGVDAIFLACPVIVFPHAPRKVFVKRADVQALIDGCTFRDGQRVR